MVLVHDKLQSESYEGYFLSLGLSDLNKVQNKDNFPTFDWRSEILNPERYCYKLVVEGNNDIQALVSYSMDEGFLTIHYLEKNNMNTHPIALSITGPVLSFVSHESEYLGNEGFVVILIKKSPRIIRHYERYGALYIGKNRMIIDDVAAKELIALYYD